MAMPAEKTKARTVVPAEGLRHSEANERWRMTKPKVLSEYHSRLSNSSGAIPASRMMLRNSFGWRTFWAWNDAWHGHTFPRSILVNLVTSALPS
jgi:hypothetical protein